MRSTWRPTRGACGDRGPDRRPGAVKAPRSCSLHLAARFFDVLAARALTPGEQAEVAALLANDAERSMFWGQSRADHRHGWSAARIVRSARPDRGDLVRAALLHDVGKRHARLGPVGRSLATMQGRLGSSLPSRSARYRDHGRIAARELEQSGAEPLVVAFARHHHNSRPAEIAQDDWDLLQAADRAVLGTGRRPRRTG